MLTARLAESIVRETMERVNWNINIMDKSGTIIASGDPGRVGKHHPGAEQAIRTGSPVNIASTESGRWGDAQAGINLPINCGGEVVGAIGITGPPSKIEPVSRLILMTVEMMIQQSQIALHEEWRQTTTDLLLKELLRETPDAATVESCCESLSFKLAAPFQIAVLAYGRKPLAYGSVQKQIAGLPGMQRVLAGKLQTQHLLLLFSGTEEPVNKLLLNRLAKSLEAYTTYRIGVSSPVSQPGEIRIGYREAVLALELVDKSAAGRGEYENDTDHGQSITYYSEIEGQAMMSLIPSVHRERLRRKLEPHWNNRMQETLEAYFACDLNATQAAIKLGIHRNTMIYRLEQYRDQLGYNPERFHDALLLQCMIWMQNSSGDSLPEL